MGISIFCLVAGLSLALAEITQLQMTDCGSSSDVVIRSVSVTPMPVQVPGDIHLSVDASLTNTIGSSKMSLSVKRKTFLGLEIPIPCLLHVGSCTYNDLCTTVQQMITEDWAGIMGGIGKQIQTMLSSVGVNASQCPQPPRDLRINDYTISIPSIPSVLTWFAAGDYHVNVKVNENASGKQLVCLDLQLSVTQHKEPGSSGWLLGRRKRRSQY
ncbi:ganglioside GM2 activator-like [Saccostrea echinata]|uniref:ganglioside GM2 activator-like n=1 Tax=Saccostrea echinata TaxID=191078 RepID=UPI002A8344D8|nr:ganglioside GM2 activator-like [Saccostrea echinata]